MKNECLNDRIHCSPAEHHIYKMFKHSFHAIIDEQKVAGSNYYNISVKLTYNRWQIVYMREPLQIVYMREPVA